VKPDRPTGATLLATTLALLGVATLISYPLGLLRGVPATGLDSALTIIGLGYGAFALWSGILLWRLDPSTPRVFLSWCVILALFNALLLSGTPELLTPWLIPVAITTLALLAAAYSYIRRQCKRLLDNEP